MLLSTKLDVRLVRSSDICDPHYSWSSTSMSSCMHITLLRLQEIWLTKFLATGLVIPGVKLLRDKLPTESASIVGNFGIYMAYALVSSGHLPLMNFLLPSCCLGSRIGCQSCLGSEVLQCSGHPECCCTHGGDGKTTLIDGSSGISLWRSACVCNS